MDHLSDIRGGWRAVGGFDLHKHIHPSPSFVIGCDASLCDHTKLEIRLWISKLGVSYHVGASGLVLYLFSFKTKCFTKEHKPQ